MLEAMCHFNLDAFTHYLSEGHVMGPFSRPSVSQSYVLTCADGGPIALHMSSPEKFWQGLAKAMGRPDIFDDPRYATREARIANYDALIELLRGTFRGQPRAVWCERLAAHDVPHAPVYDTSEVLTDPQAVHLGIEISAPVPGKDAFRTIRFPVSYDGQANRNVTPPPVLNADNDGIRAEIEQRLSGRNAATSSQIQD